MIEITPKCMQVRRVSHPIPLVGDTLSNCWPPEPRGRSGSNRRHPLAIVLSKQLRYQGLRHPASLTPQLRRGSRPPGLEEEVESIQVGLHARRLYGLRPHVTRILRSKPLGHRDIASPDSLLDPQIRDCQVTDPS